MKRVAEARRSIGNKECVRKGNDKQIERQERDEHDRQGERDTRSVAGKVNGKQF